MLHEATCSATVTNKKAFKLQKGFHKLATFFAICNAYNNKKDGANLPRAKDSSDWPILTKLLCKLPWEC